MARLPRIELTNLPTPVELLRGPSEKLDTEIWVKRDDRTAAKYGGNKVRKLELLLGRARERGANAIVTAGSVGSHHVFATALYGREYGFETYAVTTPQPYSRHTEEQLRAQLAVGTHLDPEKCLGELTRRTAELMLRLRFWGRRPYFVPLGGSDVHGALAYVNAGLELAQQIDAGECPDFDGVYVAAGTCGTVAGLALGLAAGGVKTRVVAVRVFDRLFANHVRIAHLIRQAESTLRELDSRFPSVATRAIASVRVDHHELGPGYGWPTPSADAARELAAGEGLVLDETYTSKALASLLRHASGEQRGRKLLYWHTLSSAPLTSYVEQVPEAPERFVQLMRLS